MSPTSRRRQSARSLDEAAATVGTQFNDVAESTRAAPEEPDWLRAAARQWAQPAPEPVLRVAVPIWRDPWMVVGGRTFAGDVLARLGLENAFADGAERYPKVEPDRLCGTDLDLVLLPDEPYVFTADDGPEAFTTPTRLVSGRLLTWYGPAMVEAYAMLAAIDG